MYSWSNIIVDKILTSKINDCNGILVYSVKYLILSYNYTLLPPKLNRLTLIDKIRSFYLELHVYKILVRFTVIIILVAYVLVKCH